MRLLVSKPSRAGFFGIDPVGTFASALAHAAIVAGSVIGTITAYPAPEDMGELPEGLRFLVPPSTSPAPAQSNLAFTDGAGDGGTVMNATVEAAYGGRRAGSGSGEGSAGTQATSVDNDAALADLNLMLANAYQVLEVDSAAVRDPSSAAPVYPPSLEGRGVEGHVIMRFVVDSTGFVDLATVRLVESTAPEFERAVREALPKMKFRPAHVGPRAVRQLAEQLFLFEVPDPPQLALVP